MKIDTQYVDSLLLEADKMTIEKLSRKVKRVLVESALEVLPPRIHRTFMETNNYSSMAGKSKGKSEYC